MPRDPRLALALAITIPFAAVVVASSVAPASAQECVEGRVSTPDTAGRCCWPAQSWSEEHARCSGPPRCPGGLAAEGDRCVLPVLAFPGMPGGYGPSSPTGDLPAELPPPPDGTTTPVPRAIAPRVPPSAVPPHGPPVATAWPPSPPDLEHALIDPHIVRGTDETLLLGGLLTLAGGYLTSIVFAFVDEAAQNCFSFDRFGTGSAGCGSYPFAFIPFAGGLMSGFTQLAPSTGRTSVALAFAIHLPAAMLQILGAIITGIAAFGYIEEAVPAAETGSIRVGDVELEIAPYATDSQGGLWLDARF